MKLCRYGFVVVATSAVQRQAATTIATTSHHIYIHTCHFVHCVALFDCTDDDSDDDDVDHDNVYHLPFYLSAFIHQQAS